MGSSPDPVEEFAKMSEEEFLDLMTKLKAHESNSADYLDMLLSESDDDLTNSMNSVQDIDDSVRNDFINLRDALGIVADKGDVDVIEKAARYLRLAEKKNFTQGLRIELVQVSCVYLACRDIYLPVLLIDFSSHFRVSIYELGSVYCEILDIPEYRNYERHLDASIFLPHFSKCLLNGRDDEAVVKTARDNIASRDWKQTGQNLSEICGAALHAAALSRGYKFSDTDMENFGNSEEETTVIKQLIKFCNTDSGSLNDLEKPDGKDLGFLNKVDEGQGTGAPLSTSPMEIWFLLREATRRAKEAESLIESASALGNMELDQRSRQSFESAQHEIRMAIATLDRGRAYVMQAKSHPDRDTVRRKRDMKRKRRAVINPVVVAVPNPVVTPVAVPVAEVARRRSSRLLHLPGKDFTEK